MSALGASISGGKDPRMENDKWIGRAFNKAGQLIVQSRFADDKIEYDEYTNKWFNVLTSDVLRVAKDISARDLEPLAPMVIDVFVEAPPDGMVMAVGPADGAGSFTSERGSTRESTRTSSAVGAPNDAPRPIAQRVLLERWKLAFNPGAKATLPSDRVYLRLIVLFRNLFSMTRLLPAYRLISRCRARQMGPLSITYSLEKEKAPAGFDMRPSIFEFQPVATPTGTLTMRVAYRPNCNLEPQHKEDVIPSSEIQDDFFAKPSGALGGVGSPRLETPPDRRRSNTVAGTGLDTRKETGKGASGSSPPVVPKRPQGLMTPPSGPPPPGSEPEISPSAISDPVQIPGQRPRALSTASAPAFLRPQAGSSSPRDTRFPAPAPAPGAPAPAPAASSGGAFVGITGRTPPRTGLPTGAPPAWGPAHPSASAGSIGGFAHIGNTTDAPFARSAPTRPRPMQSGLTGELRAGASTGTPGSRSTDSPGDYLTFGAGGPPSGVSSTTPSVPPRDTSRRNSGGFSSGSREGSGYGREGSGHGREGGTFGSVPGREPTFGSVPGMGMAGMPKDYHPARPPLGPPPLGSSWKDTPVYDFPQGTTPPFSSARARANTSETAVLASANLSPPFDVSAPGPTALNRTASTSGGLGVTPHATPSPIVRHPSFERLSSRSEGDFRFSISPFKTSLNDSTGSPSSFSSSIPLGALSGARESSGGGFVMPRMAEGSDAAIGAFVKMMQQAPPLRTVAMRDSMLASRSGTMAQSVVDELERFRDLDREFEHVMQEARTASQLQAESGPGDDSERPFGPLGNFLGDDITETGLPLSPTAPRAQPIDIPAQRRFEDSV